MSKPSKHHGIHQRAAAAVGPLSDDEASSYLQLRGHATAASITDSNFIALNTDSIHLRLYELTMHLVVPPLPGVLPSARRPQLPETAPLALVPLALVPETAGVGGPSKPDDVDESSKSKWSDRNINFSLRPSLSWMYGSNGSSNLTD